MRFFPALWNFSLRKYDGQGVFITQPTKSKSLFEELCWLFLLYSRIFSYVCNRFSNIYQPLTSLKTRNIISVRCTFSHLVLLTVQNPHRRALLFIDNRPLIEFFSQTKLSSIYRHRPIVTYWAFMKRQALLITQAKLRTATIMFFYFWVAIVSGEILASVWKEKKTLKSWNAAISKYIQEAFCLLCDAWKSC